MLQHLAAAQAATQAFDPHELFTSLLTVEGLFFAATSIAIGFTGSSQFGPAMSLSPRALANCSAAMLAIIAIATVVAWSGVFAGSHWPPSCDARFAAVALLFAIAAQPAISVAVAIGIWRG